MRNPTLNLVARIARQSPIWLKKMVYRSGPLANLIRGMLNQAAPQGFTQVTVAAGALAGAELELDLQVEKDYWLGTYEMDLQAALQHFTKPGMVVYDLGANIGYITLMMARLVGEKGHVYAFEALPRNVARLQGHLVLNDLTTNVTVVSGAVVDTPGPVQFLPGPSGGTGKVTGAAGRELRPIDDLEVEGIALDNFVYQQGHPLPQMIKLDIEGGEVRAIPGMAEVLMRARPILLLELHGPESAQVTWDALNEANYRVHQMKSGFPLVDSWEELDWKAYLVAQPENRVTSDG